MLNEENGRHFTSRRGGRSGIRERKWRNRRAVTDVVATILLLALTVVLFASIFAFVTSFPAPPAQNANQFQAQIIQSANGSRQMVQAISILHLAGPAVPQNSQIYLKSAVHPKGPEFVSPYTLAQGGIPATTVWNLGQTWYLTDFTPSCHPTAICNPILPDNITIYIVTGANLIFSVVLPGTILNTPPTFLSVGTVPGVPAVGEGFTLTASISGVISTNTVKVNLEGLGSNFPTVAQAMTFVGTTGTWNYVVGAGNTTAAGTFYAFITAITTAGKTGSSAVPVSISTSSTLLSTAFALGNPSTPATCTSSHNPYAACFKSAASYYFSVTITTSLVTFGSVIFQVVSTTTPRTTYSATYDAVFAISLNAAPKTADANWSVSGNATTLVPMALPGTGFTYYAGAYTGTTALYASSVTDGFVISVDMGIVAPPATLMFEAIGTGAYSGIVSVAIP